MFSSAVNWVGDSRWLICSLGLSFSIWADQVSWTNNFQHFICSANERKSYRLSISPWVDCTAILPFSSWLSQAAVSAEPDLDMRTRSTTLSVEWDKACLGEGCTLQLHLTFQWNAKHSLQPLACTSQLTLASTFCLPSVCYVLQDLKHGYTLIPCFVFTWARWVSL